MYFCSGDFRANTAPASKRGWIPTPRQNRRVGAMPPPLPLMLSCFDFFFCVASPSSTLPSFFLFRHPTRLSGAVWMGDRFEAIRLFQRNEFTPKKKWARWGKRRSMAYCAVSHVVWLFGRGERARKYGRGGLIHLALSLFNICSRLTAQLVLYPFSDASHAYWSAPVHGVRDKYHYYLIL